VVGEATNAIAFVAKYFAWSICGLMLWDSL